MHSKNSAEELAIEPSRPYRYDVRVCSLRSKHFAVKGKGAMTTKDGKFIRREGSTGRFVHFRESGVQVDVGRYLKSNEGRRALEKIETASKQFRTSKKTA
jgi:hypothetical protein